MKKIFTLVVFLLFTSPAIAENNVGGVDHVGLSVSDLSASEAFFKTYAGFEVFSRDESYPAAFLKNDSVIITLWQVKNPENAIKFDRKKNIGLHHLAFKVDSFESLNSLHEKFAKDPNVIIEFSPELLGDGPTKHMMVYEPSGNRIEFIHRAKK